MKIKKIVMHCSDTPDYPYGSPDFDRFGAKDIDKWHIERGFDCIGYHWVVRRSGIIEKGRMETVQGAHCLGENHDSIGVCYIGRKSPTTQQIAALYVLLSDVIYRHKLDITDIKPHSFFNRKKTCPGFDMQSLLRAFLDMHAIDLETILLF